MKLGKPLTVADFMTQTPATVNSEATGSEALELLDDGQIEHVPVIEDGACVGLWMRDSDHSLTLREGGLVGSARAENSAEIALNQLFEGKEAVLVWQGAEPTGILTRSDVRRLVNEALVRGIGARGAQVPVVVRFLGPEGGGKGTLIMRTLPLLRHCQMGLVTSHEPPEDFDRNSLEGCPALFGQDIKGPVGLDQTVRDLGDVQLVLLDDRPDDYLAAGGIGEDLRALVIPVSELQSLKPETFASADALIVTKLDLDPSFDFSGYRKWIMDEYPDLTVIGVAAALGDRGMHAWRRWLQRGYLPRLHWQ